MVVNGFSNGLSVDCAIMVCDGAAMIARAAAQVNNRFLIYDVGK